MSWITGISSRSRIGSSITGIPIPVDRMFQLSISFAQHCKYLNSANPLRCFMSPRIPPDRPVSSRNLLFYLKLTNLTAFLPQVQLPAETPFPVILDNRILNYHLDKFQSYNTSAKFILPHARIINSDIIRTRRTPACDSILRISDPALCIYAIRWRCSTFMFSYRCTCGTRFSRRHIFSCNLLSPIINQLQDSIIVFNEECSRFNLTESDYCIIDSLLNNHKYDLFEVVLQYLGSTLSFYMSQDILPDPPLMSPIQLSPILAPTLTSVLGRHLLESPTDSSPKRARLTSALSTNVLPSSSHK